MTAPPALPVVRRSWWLRLSGRPPRPNQTMRGSFSASREKQRRQRYAIQTAVQEWKDKTAIALCDAQVPHGLARIRVSAVFYRTVLNRADEDGDRSAMKPILDAIVKYGIIKDDTRQYLEWGTVIERKGKPEIHVLIEDISGEGEG